MKPEDRNVFLIDKGGVWLSKQRRRTITRVLWVSAALHVLGLAVFGSITILEALREETSVFVVPTPMRTYQPRQLEHQVRVQEQQRSASRPQVTPRLVSAKPSDLALPEIRIDPKSVTTSFQPQFKAVASGGVGIGMGQGYGLGGFGSGVSRFNFFGIRGRGARVAILLDASISMAEEDEQRGVTPRGIENYQRVKDRIDDVIGALGYETMFNVIVFAQTVGVWRNEMQVATDENREAVRTWLEPVNSRVAWDAVGFRDGLSSSPHGLPATGGTTRFDIALAKAFEQKADTVLVICDGDVWVTRDPTSEERAAYEAAMEKWRRDNRSALEQQARDAERARYEERRVWIPGQPAQPAQPARPAQPAVPGNPVIRERGGGGGGGRPAIPAQPAQPARPATPGRFEMQRVRVDQPRQVQTSPQPRSPGSTIWTVDDYHRHVDLLYESFYKEEGRSMPVIHVIGYRSARTDSSFLSQFVRNYGGEFRRVSTVR
jgi:hypothetical protein